MPIQPLKKPLKYAGDPAGPFAGGRRLRVLLDLPSEGRGVDPFYWDSIAVPDRDHMLWTLCQREDIEVFWLANDSDTGDGSVHLREVDRSADTLLYVTTHPGGATMRGVSLYSQVERLAAGGGPRSLEVLTKAALADDLRVDVVATVDQELLDLDGFYSRRLNAMTATDAIAIVGLYLRSRDDRIPVVGPSRLHFDQDSLAWTAVRAQVPDGWEWGSALVDHDSIANDDSVLIFSAMFERLSRGLTQRDALHRAVNQPAGNRSRKKMVEAFDYLMMNLVGAFDATARSAHLGAGLPWDKRHRSKWQDPTWRLQVGVRELDKLFDGGEPADDLFWVLRMLRNTVHGAELGSLRSRGIGSDEEVAAILPRDDAIEIAERLARLDSTEDWGIGPTSPLGTHFDAARLTEAVLPRVFDTLNQVVAMCPRGALKSSGRPLTTGPGDKIPFDLGTRTRACLVYGLNVPDV